MTCVVIVTNHRGAPGNLNCGYEGRLLSEDNEVIGCGSSRNELIEGDHTKAVFAGAISLLLALPDGSHAELLNTLNYAVEELNCDRQQRQATGYLKSDGKSLLEDHVALKRIDEIVEAKNLTLSARRPSSYEEMCHVKALKAELRKHPNVVPFSVAS